MGGGVERRFNPCIVTYADSYPNQAPLNESLTFESSLHKFFGDPLIRKNRLPFCSYIGLNKRILVFTLLLQH